MYNVYQMKMFSVFYRLFTPLTWIYLMQTDGVWWFKSLPYLHRLNQLIFSYLVYGSPFLPVKEKKMTTKLD